MMRRFTGTIMACFIGSLGLASSADDSQATEHLAARIDTYLAAGVSEGFSGAILVAKAGTVIINKGYGVANKENNTLNTPTTVFDIGSNTKQFTGAAILKLVQFKKLALTDPLGKFFENLPEDKKNITVHQLLTHTAGFKEAIGRDFQSISETAYFEKLFASKLLHEPGSTYSYANTGYSVLGRIIELVSGQGYEAFLNKHLFAPAGMQQTGYLLPKWNKADLARGYTRGIIDRGATVTRYAEDGDINWHLKGNGGINSTQEDMYKWIKALKANTVLPKALFAQYTSPYTVGYGYGWGISKSKADTKRVTHNGSNSAFDHSIIWYPKEDLLILFANNSSSPQVERIAYTVEKMIHDDHFQAEPIKKNPYLLVFDFMKHHEARDSKELLSQIKTAYPSGFPSDVLNRMGNMNVERDTAWAIALFEINVQQFPKDGNLWDSLGDGYLMNKQPGLAKTSYEKALALKPETDCFWCENSSKKLRQLKAGK